MTKIKVRQIKSKPSKGIIKARGHLTYTPFGAFWTRTALKIVFLS